MKKFRFSLETVLDYKQQVLESLQIEHAAIQAKVRAQEERLRGLEEQHWELDAEFSQRKLEGIAILDAMKYEQYLRATERAIEEAEAVLEDLREQEEAKRSEVVEAKKETSSIEKLRERKLDGYNKALRKSEEAMIDELVSTKRVMEAQSA
jgi:flagellar FliJ protein